MVGRVARAGSRQAGTHAEDDAPKNPQYLEPPPARRLRLLSILRLTPFDLLFNDQVGRRLAPKFRHTQRHSHFIVDVHFRLFSRVGHDNAIHDGGIG